MPLKRPRACLSNASFASQLEYLDRRHNRRTAWAHYDHIFPPETLAYDERIYKYKKMLTSNQIKTVEQGRRCVAGLYRYRQDMARLAQEFWTAHAQYPI